MRIASRKEGGFVNFYYAMEGTMDKAVLLISVRNSVIDIVGWETFKDLAVKALEAAMKEVGVTPERWDLRPAPEHERSGNG